MDYEHARTDKANRAVEAMSSFVENALARKPLSIVRRQAHLGDDESRYAPHGRVSAGEDAGGGGADGRPGSAAGSPGGATAREAPLRHMSLFDLVGAYAAVVSSRAPLRRNRVGRPEPQLQRWCLNLSRREGEVGSAGEGPAGWEGISDE